MTPQNVVNIGSGNGFLSVNHQGITLSNADLKSMKPY